MSTRRTDIVLGKEYEVLTWAEAKEKYLDKNIVYTNKVMDDIEDPRPYECSITVLYNGTDDEEALKVMDYYISKGISVNARRMSRSLRVKRVN